jgi:hypothetical protein
MGGKTATSQQAVSIPPQVLAQYSSVNQKANQTANIPFQTYGGQLVAPINSQQATGIAGTNTAANEAQPYYSAATGDITQTQANTTGINNAATGLAGASAEQVNATPLTASSIDQYLSPYLSTVLGSTEALQNQSNQQQQAGQLGTAIESGAFGGDRTGIAAANLEQQQNLENSNLIAGIANQGYNTALSTAEQQQGVNLGAGQANRAALAAAGSELAGIGQTAYGEGANTATTIAGLGSGAQTAGLQGAAAEIGAGTLEQQTAQAGDTALYNQFLQQQSYPFQVDQFLANIAEGTGALSGSTTTTTQPGGFFSDRRLKYDIEKIGETFDGQPIFRYKTRDDPRTQVGLIAQDVEKKHPRAVGLSGGYRFVDYGRATDEAANKGHFAAGGLVNRAGAYAYGGDPAIVDPVDMQAILAAQSAMYVPRAGETGAYGSERGSGPYGGAGRVPPPTGAVARLVTPGGLRAAPTPMQNAQSVADLGKSAAVIYHDFNKKNPAQQPTGLVPNPDPVVPPEQTTVATSPNGFARGGRTGFDEGGMTDIDAALAAQERMYQQPGQRQIPNQSGSTHQLAVASGSPPPPASGASNVNQSIGLAQKGYQAYKHFNPSTPPTSGAPTVNYSGALTDTSGMQESAQGYLGGIQAPADATVAPADATVAPAEGLAGANTASMLSEFLKPHQIHISTDPCQQRATS